MLPGRTQLPGANSGTNTVDYTVFLCVPCSLRVALVLDGHALCLDQVQGAEVTVHRRQLLKAKDATLMPSGDFESAI